MRKNFGVKTWLYPMPVLIVGTYDENGNADAMNAAWGGIHDTNQIGVCIDPSHKTAENLQKTGEFTVSIGTLDKVAECDYVGIVSAKDEPKKLKKANLTPEKSEFVNAPIFKELPMTLECRLISYDNSCGCAVGEIINISVDDSVLDENGKIDPAKLQPICFDPVNLNYIKLGEVVGKAFAVGKSLDK